MMILLLLLIVLFLWLVYFWYKRRHMYKLAAKIPELEGTLPIIGILHKVAGDNEAVMSYLKEGSYLSMNHDGIATAWLGPLLYFIVVDPVDLEYILKTCLEKDDVHRFIREATGNASIFAPVSIWKPRRKIMALVLGPKILESFTKVLEKNSLTLVKNLAQCNTGKKIDIWPFLSSCSLATILESTFGVNIGAQENPDHPIIKAMNLLLNLFCERLFHLWLHPDWLYRLLPQYKMLQESTKFLYNFADKIIEAKRNENGITPEIKDKQENAHKNNTLLDIMMKSFGGENGFTNLELREEAGVLVIAATDTTATAVSSTLLLLAKYPDVQERVYQELFEVFVDSDRPLLKTDIKRLTYLNQVIKETLRLLPPVPIIVRKVLEDMKLPSGRVLPAGSNAICSIWGSHRDPKYWGTNAEYFDPDRFQQERFNIKHACSFMPFSNGPRNCIGYRYAMMSMTIVLSAVLREYRVVPDRENGPIPRVRLRMDIMMKVVDGYQITLEKRHQVRLQQ